MSESNPMDAYKGMDAEAFKKSVTGNQETKESVQQQTASEDSKKETNKDQKQQVNSEGANVDEKDISVLANTFNLDYNSLPNDAKEGILRMAKSYREAQSKYTSVAQKAKDAEKSQEAIDNFNRFLKENPDINQAIQNKLSGNQAQSGTDISQNKPQPSSTIGKSATVDTNQLIKGGYLSEQDLQGLDELAKQRVITKAELAFFRDEELSKFRDGLKTEKENLTKAERAAQVKRLNSERLNEGVDRVVGEYGIDFTSLDDETVSAIQKRALRILDPNDPTGQTIDQDAMYDATLKELSLRGKLPNRQAQPNVSIDAITDTGRQFSRNNGNIAKPTNSREDYYKQKMAERFSSMKDTSGAFTKN